MAKLVDALALGASGATLESSSLSIRTKSFMLLHNFNPEPILFSLGQLAIHWYGVFMVLGIIAGMIVTLRLARYYKFADNFIFDLFFWLIISALVGARIYDVLLNSSYYLSHPLQSLEIWKGGLAIHGAIIAGIIVLLIFAKQQKTSFFKIGSLIVPGLALGQAIGRWGNYFNQELFGLPTNSFIGIPINIVNRSIKYLPNIYFQPTFLYESLGCLLIFLFLFNLNLHYAKRKKFEHRLYIWSVSFYMILYSILRFMLEYIRIDKTPYFLGLRLPQIVSLFIIITFLLIIAFKSNDYQDKNKIS